MHVVNLYIDIKESWKIILPAHYTDANDKNDVNYKRDW